VYTDVYKCIQIHTYLLPLHTHVIPASCSLTAHERMQASEPSVDDCMYVHAYIRIRIYTYICTHTQTHKHTNTHTHMCVCVYVCVYVICICVCMDGWMFIDMLIAGTNPFAVGSWRQIWARDVAFLHFSQTASLGPHVFPETG